jgi:hypothetical protein
MTELTALLRHHSACCRTQPTFTTDQSIPIVELKGTALSEPLTTALKDRASPPRSNRVLVERYKA